MNQDEILAQRLTAASPSINPNNMRRHPESAARTKANCFSNHESLRGDPSCIIPQTTKTSTGELMTTSAPVPSETKSQLRKTMGFWDVLLFNIATVLGPRWIAAAGHNGTSSISLWVLAAIFFFIPGAFVINELSSRFPEEGGLYVWAREAFGDFHGFIAGWTYWIYTVFYFPGLLLASASMSAYIIGGRGAALAQDRTFLLSVSLAMLLVAVVLNIIGLNVGKWLQNAGGIGTYVPLLMLALVAIIVVFKRGSATHFTVQNMLPAWNWSTVNFWS